MMRGQTLLTLGFLVTGIASLVCVALLAALTPLSGSIIALLSVLVGVATFLIYVFIMTKCGY